LAFKHLIISQSICWSDLCS